MTLREIMSEYYNKHTNLGNFSSTLNNLTINGAGCKVWTKDLLKLYDMEVKDYEIIDDKGVSVTFPTTKEVCRSDFYTMIIKSWTWAKLTDKEKELCTECFKNAFLYGNYKQRWEILNNCYTSFLAGCGYENQCDWRENCV